LSYGASASAAFENSSPTVLAPSPWLPLLLLLLDEPALLYIPASSVPSGGENGMYAAQRRTQLEQEKRRRGH
jgi:hypothetical protein